MSGVTMVNLIHYLFLLCSLVLGAIILYVTYKILKRNKYIRKINFRDNNLLDKIYYKKTFKDRIYKKYYYKANLKKYFKDLNIYVPLHFLLIFDLILSFIVFQLSKTLLIAGIFYILFMISIFIVLEIIISKNELNLSNDILKFISILNRWIHVKEDIVFGFSKAREEQFHYPLDEMIHTFVVQIKSGMMVEDAFNSIIYRVDNQLLKEIFINLRQVNKRRGDLRKLLENYEQEIYKLESEFDKRNQKTLIEKITILGLILSIFIGTILYLNYYTLGQSFYLKTTEGKILLSVYSVVFMVGIALFIYFSKDDFR